MKKQKENKKIGRVVGRTAACAEMLELDFMLQLFSY